MPWSEALPSGKYRAVWRDQTGRRHSRAGFTQRAAARRYAGEQEGMTRRGETAFTGRSITWGAWCDHWLTLRRVEASTRSSDATRIERWLRPKWGGVPLGRISQESVQAWVNELDQEMGAASVAKVYQLLAASLKAAVRSHQLGVNPCHDVQLPTIPPSDERFLTREEFDAVIGFMTEPYRTAAIILVGTGMRFGEMAGLHRHRIDWQAAAIDVHETWDGERIKAYPKGRRKRRVPMVSWVEEAILTLPVSAVRRCGLPHARNSRCGSPLLVVGPNGAPLNARNMLRRHWGPAVARAGLEHARQHDLRHGTASWLAQSGRSMTEIAAILGHAETTVTARYAHLADTHMDGVRDALEGKSA